MTESITRKLVARNWFRSLVVVPFWTLRFFYHAVREGSLPFLRFYPGYHGSTIPSGRFLARNRRRIFDAGAMEGDGVDSNRDCQRELLEQFSRHYERFTPPETPSPGRLYHYGNPMFGFNDAFILYGILQAFRPKRVIEVGSGFSSALMLDISREFLPDTRFTFIDPYSQTIQQVLASRPEGNYELVREEIQDVDPAIYSSLGAGDILFVDTSHSVKIASDLSAIFFRILPALNAGVIVHIHDIVYPWEYPEDMVMEGRTYNELYFVRAFLQFNSTFEVIYNSSQMELECRSFFDERMPGYFKQSGQKTGQSLWLRKIR